MKRKMVERTRTGNIEEMVCAIRLGNAEGGGNGEDKSGMPKVKGNM